MGDDLLFVYYDIPVLIRCIRSLTVSSNETMAKYLLDKTPNCWQSASNQGKHWIRLELHENVLINMLAITVNPSDCSHMPSLVVVRVGDSVETLKDFRFVCASRLLIGHLLIIVLFLMSLAGCRSNRPT